MNKNSSQKALLARAIDYAGLFPPAALDLPQALANYQAYQRSSDAWALGRFVIPAGRLPELARLQEADRDIGSRDSEQELPLSVVVASTESKNEGDVAARGVTRVAALELKAATADAARTGLAGLPEGKARYVEVPVGPAGAPALEVIADAGVFAKLRTGGVAVEAFPTPEDLLWSLQWLARQRVPWKATAGLHHLWRGSYPLSYEPDAREGTMYGYMNVFLAALLCWTEAPIALAREALLEESGETLHFESDSLIWRGRRFGSAMLRELRKSFLHAFGSCSFREPLDELAAGGWS